MLIYCWRFLHLRWWDIMACSFLVMFLCGFSIRVMVISWNELGSIPSASTLKTRLYKIDMLFSLNENLLVHPSRSHAFCFGSLLLWISLIDVDLFRSFISCVGLAECFCQGNGPFHLDYQKCVGIEFILFLQYRFPWDLERWPPLSFQCFLLF